MNIAIIGSSGFIGKNLHNYLSKEYNVLPISKNTVDVLDRSSLHFYLKNNSIDIIINCLTFGIKEIDTYGRYDILEKNLVLHFNIVSYDPMQYISIGSGSEFDTSKSIDNISEIYLLKRTPKTTYAFSKNLISRDLLTRSNASTLRLFGCFGVGEHENRLLNRYINSAEVFLLENDRYFDYFSIQDFCVVVKHVIKNNISFLDCNCVYQEKIKLSTLLEIFSEVKNIPKNFRVVSNSNLNYTGDCTKLYSLNLPLQGLRQGLIEWQK